MNKLLQVQVQRLTRRKLLKYGFFSGAAATLPASIFLNGCDSRPERKNLHTGGPNIVVVLCDTLRPDYLSFYGFPKKTSPFLAELADKSVVFKRAFSTSSWTAPSVASLFTSRYPHRQGVVEGFFCHKQRMDKFKKDGKVIVELNRIPSDIPSMPEIFKALGYKTFGVAANRNIAGEIGFSRGFDEFKMTRQASAKDLYKCIKNWRKQIFTGKSFVYVHFNDVHAPYDKHLRYYDKPKDPVEEPKARYLSEITYMDKYIAKLYKILHCNQNTIFVALSDHGEEFLDHGDIRHGSKLYRELTQVLMMFHAPFLPFRQRDININVSLIDVLPTLLKLIKVKTIEGMEGHCLKQILMCVDDAALTEKLHNRTLFAHRIIDDPQLNIWAAVHQHWNMIEFQDETKKLFDHRIDSRELHDVFSKNLHLTSQLISKLKYFKEQGKRNSETTPVTFDKSLVETLKSLGYTDD